MEGWLMTNYGILKTQANEVMSELLATGHEPSDFSWELCSSRHTSDALVSKLVHVPTGHYFVFDVQQQDHWCECSPGMSVRIESRLTETWSRQLTAVMLWLMVLRGEISAPDLWASIGKGMHLAEVRESTPEADSPFSAEERERIGVTMRQLREAIQASIAPTQAELQAIDGSITYLIAASDRVGRKDWGIILVGSIVGLILSHAISSDRAQILFRLVINAFWWIVSNRQALQ
jgi:hypothetical protein